MGDAVCKAALANEGAATLANEGAAGLSMRTLMYGGVCLFHLRVPLMIYGTQ